MDNVYELLTSSATQIVIENQALKSDVAKSNKTINWLVFAMFALGLTTIILIPPKVSFVKKSTVNYDNNKN